MAHFAFKILSLFLTLDTLSFLLKIISNGEKYLKQLDAFYYCVDSLPSSDKWNSRILNCQIIVSGALFSHL